MACTYVPTTRSFLRSILYRGNQTLHVCLCSRAPPRGLLVHCSVRRAAGAMPQLSAIVWAGLLLPVLWNARTAADVGVGDSEIRAAERTGNMAPTLLSAVELSATSASILTALRAAKGASHLPGISPQQVHLAPGPVPSTSIRVTWITLDALPAGSTLPAVTWWPAAGATVAAAAAAASTGDDDADADAAPSPTSAAADTSTYTAGEDGWHGRIYSAVMTGLAPGSTYQYTVGAPGTATSPVHTFSAPPAPNPAATVRVALLADMGTYVPLGWAVAARLTQEHLSCGAYCDGGRRGFYDAVALVGDLSYATISPGSCSDTNPGCDELETTWDMLGMQNEGFTATAPLWTAVGNHEHVGGNITRFDPNGTTAVSTVHDAFAAYSARYPMPSDAPSGGEGAFWWATTTGPLTFVVASSEHPYQPGTPQYGWLNATLGAVDRAVTPWVVVALHRPILSAAVLEWKDHRPGGKLSAALEPLLMQHKVDVVTTGHIHSYDRTFAVFNGTVVAHPVAGTQTFVDPGAPVHVCNGASGGLPENVFFDPLPEWSAEAQEGNFGYGRLTVNGATSLTYEFVGVYGETLSSWGINKTVAAE